MQARVRSRHETINGHFKTWGILSQVYRHDIMRHGDVFRACAVVTQLTIANGEPLPVDFTNRVIYYVGPVDPVGEEIVGPAGPTTATRMDKFMDMMLDQGLLGCVGKAERGPAATQAIAKHQSAYLMAVGGAAYLVARAIKGSKVVGFADLGMEAIYEFEVKDFPVTVAVDSSGENVHTTAPLIWRKKIADEKLLEPAE